MKKKYYISGSVLADVSAYINAESEEEALELFREMPSKEWRFQPSVPRYNIQIDEDTLEEI